MDNKFDNNPYLALPRNLRGSFCQIREGNKFRFFEINYVKYSNDDVDRLIQMNSLDESVLGSYIKLIGMENIFPDTFFLYKLQTYIGNPDIKDAWEFNEKISEFKEYGFTTFQELIEFCNNNWKLTTDSFVPIDETNIP